MSFKSVIRSLAGLIALRKQLVGVTGMVKLRCVKYMLLIMQRESWINFRQLRKVESVRDIRQGYTKTHNF